MEMKNLRYHLTEELLHYAWKHNLYNNTELKSVFNEPIHVIHPGYQNFDEGPDFLDARIKIGEVLWAGSVEIHVDESDWEQHNHNENIHYEHVVLHVVYNANKGGNIVATLPTLELNGRIPPSLFFKYSRLLYQKEEIKCRSFMASIPEIKINHWKDRMLIERLESKSEEILICLKHNKNDWEQTFFESLSKYFGGKVNRSAFFHLAKSIPIKLLNKYRYNLFQLEALFYGNAGFLNSKSNDVYQMQLYKEFNYLSKLHNLKRISNIRWKHFRMRPSSFPAIRIAQLVSLIHLHFPFFQEMLDEKSLEKAFRKISVSDYWREHYHFGKRSKVITNKRLGEEFIKHIIVNVYAPYQYTYGKYFQKNNWQEKAIETLMKVKPEQNNLTKLWKNTNVEVASAADSQAVIQWLTYYCKPIRCLSCPIGNSIVNTNCNAGLNKSQVHIFE